MRLTHLPLSQYQNIGAARAISAAGLVSWPDKPPPDDGYTFKIKKQWHGAGQAWLCHAVCQWRHCSAHGACPEGSDLRQKRMVRASALGASGIGLVLVICLR